ncbi:MAG: NifU N-terminal domain-containing protein, partial [Phenylobacterium sp.]
MFIQTDTTPNPQVLKFLPGRTVMESGSRDFRSPDEARDSPLALEVFGLEGVNRVFFGGDFITVGKIASAEWDHLKAPVLAAIMDHFTSGRRDPVAIEDGHRAGGEAGIQGEDPHAASEGLLDPDHFGDVVLQHVL